eukprot:CAMPEP_0117575262 /NCGR_PEP_ID=MMETSP0784-20121206/62105_1 /TAXON_ID=39447 /ORGANISM="" /LENGTH=329 /DNA_ID=CAMNT_0005374305 /DNA_START=33 /DNA_END=1022 /DNA_ORIENTATION=+
MGGNVDRQFAREVLAAHDWNLEAALNNFLGDCSMPAAIAPARPTDTEAYREAMRTGYTDTLMAPISPTEQRRLDEEREERARHQRLAEEQARERENEEAAARYRKEAERRMFEQRQREKRGQAPVVPAAEEARQQNQAAEVSRQTVGQTSRPVVAEASAVEQVRLSEEDAKRLQAEIRQREAREAEELHRERAEAEARRLLESTQSSSSKAEEKKSDEVVSALVALRKRYIDQDPAGLLTCLKTIRTYVNNLARNPQEAKYQRINCENSAFRTRVAAFEGSLAVLTACGFQQEDGILAVGADFVKTKGSKLWGVLAKVDVMISQMPGTA